MYTLLLLDPVKQNYICKLDELMRDTKNTILLYYLIIGSSGLGKSTTRKRLIEEITNLVSLSEEERNHCSTHLAEFSQVLAFMDEDKTQLTLKAPKDPDEQMQALFAYVNSSKITDPDHPSSPPESHPFSDQTSSDGKDQPTNGTSPMTTPNKLPTVITKVIPAEVITPPPVPATVDVNKVIARLRDLVRSGDYIDQLASKQNPSQSGRCWWSTGLSRNDSFS